MGHPARPFLTLEHALAVAQARETVEVYPGVYRESLVAKTDGVTVRAAKALPGAPTGDIQKAVLSGADLVAGWRRQGDGWSAPLAAAPKKLLRDGKLWTDFSYDIAAKTISVKGFDPRLHVFETVVREMGLDLEGKKVRIEGLALENFSGDPIKGASGAMLVDVTIDGKPAQAK
jgi:hypothetical protein